MQRTSVKFIVLAPAILAGFCLKAVRAGDQVDAILSQLPAKSSAEYKALHDLAAPTGGQAFAMTGAEMWTVPAALFGVTRGRGEGGRQRAPSR